MAGSVLVVDASQLHIDLLTNLLASHKLSVHGCTDVTHALKLFEENHPDLVIVDLSIESAPELLRHLTSHATGDETIVIAPDPESESQALEQGFTNVIRRGNSLDELLDIVAGKLGTGVVKLPEDPRPGILIVEDDPEVARLFSGVLRKNGYRTRTTDKGSEAMAVLFQDSGIRLVLIDIMLPDIGGIELLTQIQYLGSPPTAIIITGLSDQEIAKHALKIGAFDYLAKPISPTSLLVAVTAGLAHSEYKAR